ncbi:MAG TPA: MBL fold metallo-hydrolase, partial [Negativicutes bacterium]
TAVEDLDGILITHEHRDHVSGLQTLTKKYRLPVYARPDSWAAMYCRENLPDDCCRNLGDSLDIGQVKIEPFSISHDAADPVGFSCYYGSKKVSLATDFGFATETVKKALALSDALVLEANHDLDMLKNGAYPGFLKRRILSDRGHLSNVDAGLLLSRLARKQHTEVFLAHLSKENNRLELAESTVSHIMQEQGWQIGPDVGLHLTYPDQIASLTLAEEEL